ncbi:MAG: condensation domain-containing protein, partial [Bacteroidota bacterium]
LARFRPDGIIEFIGRKDAQVKIRGYRVELGEIETVLHQLPQVRQAVVLAQKDSSDTKQLIAYVVPQHNFDKKSIQTALKEKLPDYMVPAIMVELSELPLTANGKVNKNALPLPDISHLSTQAYLAPRNKTEQYIADLWSNLLNIDNIGVHDDFFDLGGHSLLATRVISAIRTQLKVELSIRDLFQHTTLVDLAHFIDQQEQQIGLPKLTPQERPKHIPLSYAQERLWFIDKLEGSLHYHISRVLKIRGALNVQAFEKAFQSIVDRHELLRTVLRSTQGQAHQVILPTGEWTIDTIDQTKVQSAAQQIDFIDQLISTPFDLSNDYPLRIHLIQFQPEEYCMIMLIHHIASDGWSFSILFSEFIEAYQKLSQGESLNWPALPIQYADFAIWQRRYHEGVILEKQLNYWKEQLANYQTLNLPTDLPRPAIQSLRGDNCLLQLDAQLTQQINDLANAQGVTPFMLLLAAFKILLYRYSGQADLCVGAPIAGRTIKEVESLIGFFINTLIIRTQLNHQQPFTALLAQVKQTVLDAYANQMAPFEKVVEALEVSRDQSRSPIFQIAFAYQNMPTDIKGELEDLDIEDRHEATFITAQRDMSVTIEDRPDGLMLAYFDRRTQFEKW